MAINFRKRKKILPGIYLNFSKKGISTTLGPRGANINFGKKGAFLNTGIPGTGFYSRQKIGDRNGGNPSFTSTNSFAPTPNRGKYIPTSKSLEELKKHIEEAREERKDLETEIKQQTLDVQGLEQKLKNRQIGIGKIITKFFGKPNTIEKLQEEVKGANEYLADLYSQYEESRVNINIESDVEILEQYQKIKDAYIDLSKAHKIWDIVSERITTETKSAASTAIERREVHFTFDDIDFILSEQLAFHLENANGDNLYIYPAFVLQLDTSGDITLIDLHDLRFRFQRQRFLEEKHAIPTDSPIIDYSWAKVNKDGSPDKRFAGNYQIPVVEYGAFEFSTDSGLREVYYISNLQLAEKFAKEFRRYLALLIPSGESRINEDIIEVPKVNSDSKDGILLNDDFDPLTQQAARLVVLHQLGSTSLIQRSFKLGYNRAGRIIDQLEEMGIVGPFEGSKAREVLIADEYALESLLNNLKRTPDSLSYNSNFSYTYYTLLKDFSITALHISNKLNNSKIIITKFGLKETDVKAAIPYLITYEFCQILHKLIGNKLSEISLEAVGLALLNNKLYSGTILDEGYQTIVELFENGRLRESVLSTLDVGKSQAIKFNLSTNDGELVWADVLTKKLPLLLALKHQDDSFFEEYCQFLYHFANIMAKADNKVTPKEESLLLEIYELMHDPLPQITQDAKVISNTNESLDEVLNELNSLIGLNEVKAEINTLINFIKVQKAREQSGLKSSTLSYHIVFTGNPGTGKTTVARILAKIYKHLGVLTEGQLVETDRSGLVAEYVGQTATKVQKTVDSALDGILFVDEAYSLVGENKDDFGKEAVATLIKRMEDDRDKLVLVLAGYTKEMADFIDTNPGLKSRFNRYISFPDYTPNELFEIFESKCRMLDYRLTEEAKTKLQLLFEGAYSTRDRSFGNGRFVRNVFEKALEQQANRIAKESSLTKEILTTITDDDIPTI